MAKAVDDTSTSTSTSTISTTSLIVCIAPSSSGAIPVIPQYPDRAGSGNPPPTNHGRDSGRWHAHT
ncbi:predicted protein [Plenodomus lingam JN3]|uniref:Predicted protein n=1 Tax=Leptosphaeria maculans (strain JN3 / isolate v23.1.3 / race Av1-4-5-6-7-8) TaxID=985895 RepID=E5A419_LEPMJ|nr:predicted protein [Plenodomus lingam JN3]CBX98364.1 predicted protein [Plenodomus lingam JN3]